MRSPLSRVLTSRLHSFAASASSLLLLGISPVWADPPAAPAATTPAPATKEDSEVKMGREAHEDMLKGGIKLVTDPVQLARVEAIGKKLAAIANKTVLDATYGTPNKTAYDYHFFIVDDIDVNAFSLPGGYIYVNKGLLRYIQSDDELAGVIGHEIIHAAHHHVAKLQHEQSKLNSQLAIAAIAAIVAKVPINDTGNLVYGLQLVALQKVNGYGQNAERDADHGGVILAQAAGYNPVGMLTFMERLERDQKNRANVELGIFRTHPPEHERASNMTAQITQMGLPINRRQTSNMLKVSVRTSASTPSAPPVSEVLVDDRLVLKTTSAERAKSLAERLDALFDSNLRLYELSRRGSTVLARGDTLFTVQPTETQVAGAATPDAISESAYKAIRTAIYRYVLEGAL